MNSSTERFMLQPAITWGNLSFVEQSLVIIVLLCTANIVSAILATTGNALVLVAVWKTPSLRSPSNVLLVGLAAADLCIGLLLQPTWVLVKVANHQGVDDMLLFSVCVYVYDIFSNVLVAVSFLTLVCVSFDRLLALILHLRYREFVTITRVLFLHGTIWTASILDHVWRALHLPSALVFEIVFVLIVVILMVLSYCKIYRIVRHHLMQIRVQDQINRSLDDRTLPDIAQYQKSVLNILYVVGLFSVSYLPWLSYLVVFLLKSSHSYSFYQVYDFLLTLLFINSCINPFLYYWRMRDIRLAVKNMIKEACT